jgi:hypothetical protein
MESGDIRHGSDRNRLHDRSGRIRCLAAVARGAVRCAARKRRGQEQPGRSTLRPTKVVSRHCSIDGQLRQRMTEGGGRSINRASHSPLNKSIGTSCHESAIASTGNIYRSTSLSSAFGHSTMLSTSLRRGIRRSSSSERLAGRIRRPNSRSPRSWRASRGTAPAQPGAEPDVSQTLMGAHDGQIGTCLGELEGPNVAGHRSAGRSAPGLSCRGG